MSLTIQFSKKYKYISFGLMAAGVAALVAGLLTDPSRTYANFLMNNFLFVSLTIGALFFFCLQFITQSGWSAMFRRVPEAVMSFLPFGGAIMLLLLFGVHDLYHWSHADAVAGDHLIAHKSPFLNTPFFAIRIALFFAAWILLTQLLRKLSLREDKIGGLQTFESMEFWSKVTIFVLAFTFSFASFDWVMSIEVHWFSTIFAFRTFAAAFYHGTALVALIVILLHQKGYFRQMNSSHLLDFSRYLFALSIIYGYLLFSQYLLIWYANIPEETVYFTKRFDNGWKPFFFINLAINFLIPFLVLLPQKLDRNIKVVKYVCILLLFGIWIDCYDMVMPEITKVPKFGLIEIGTTLGFMGLMLFAVGRSLAKAPLIPQNHPYLEESLEHHLH